MKKFTFTREDVRGITDQHHIHWGYGSDAVGYYDYKIFQDDKVKGTPTYNYTVNPFYYVVNKSN